MPTQTIALASGFLACLALIAAIGAQNAFVLRQGIRREHIAAVVAVCATSDLVLITIGVAGVGALVADHPDAITAIRYGGAAFLTGYALLAARRALRPAALTAAGDGPTRLRGVLLTCLAMTFLNPHVYLDTVVLLGALASEHAEHRWLFGVGAGTASVVWFAVLGFGATRLSARVTSPRTWRMLDSVIAVTMLTLACLLLLY
ncbi:LysE/ArgO family amino acid transporter [Mycobacterium sp. SMC-4]|uniref:LysE/ArgO family amino acid transporter n=1 Tax=Mycobacterium sp. SMC-4 TaxID=2857059 RepID=UPI0021B1F32C|nr:LysE/ArgO family amino acid transporter [Mycobacterium sp. SMC-4]UXA18400.1 LysE/ArgO family amino acid transporter [Mycobacterium sp. SMC-4]